MKQPSIIYDSQYSFDCLMKFFLEKLFFCIFSTLKNADFPSLCTQYHCRPRK